MHVPYQWPSVVKVWINALITAVSMAAFSGCAARFEAPSGKTWIVGFARVGTEIRPLGGNDRFVMIKSEQAAPVEFGFTPYGVVAGLGINSCTSGWVGASESTNNFGGAETLGFRLGGGELPWLWGLTRYKIPRHGAKTSVRVNTVRGIDLRLRTGDPALRIGYSESTITEGESTSGLMRIEFETARIVPAITISEER